MGNIPDIGEARRRKIIERKLAIKRRLAVRRGRDILGLYLESLKEKMANIITLMDSQDDKE